MAAPSIAASYTDSPRSNSEKFGIAAAVRASTLAERHRNLIVAMLHKNQFGDELWMSTESICVVMGRVCYRRKAAETDTRGRRLGPCETISRRAVQRLIDEAVALGVLAQVHGANEQVPYGGGKKFRHTATYRLNASKLVPRKTHDEYVEERDRARARNRQAHRDETQREHAADVTPIRKPAAPEKPLPPAPAAPLPARSTPDATKQAHRGTARVTRDERTALARIYMTLRKNGIQHEAAMAQACKELKLSIEDGEVALKIALAKRAEYEERQSPADRREARNQAEASVGARGPQEPWKAPECLTCDDTGEIWNRGPGKRRLPCPDCRKEGGA